MMTVSPVSATLSATALRVKVCVRVLALMVTLVGTPL